MFQKRWLLYAEQEVWRNFTEILEKLSKLKIKKSI